MRILANENMPASVIDLLRQHGHDVVWIRTDSPGARDDDILVRACAEQRLLITFDKDFGELVFRRGQRASCGVVLFRLAAPSPWALAAKVVSTLESRDDWQGAFTVVDESRVRIVPLPNVNDSSPAPPDS